MSGENENSNCDGLEGETGEYFTESDGDVDLKNLEDKCLKASPEFRQIKAKRGRPLKSKKTVSNLKILSEDFLRPFSDNMSSGKSHGSEVCLSEKGDVRSIMVEVSTEIKLDMGKVSLKLDKLINIINDLVDRVVELEKRDSDHIKRHELNEKRIIDLETSSEENERKLRLNKVLISYGEFNCNSPTLQDDVCKFIIDSLKLDPQMLNGTRVEKFGNGGHTLLLELPSANVKKEIFKARGNQRRIGNPICKNFFVNDFLTRKNVELFKKTRDLKKNGKIQSLFTVEEVLG